MQWVFFEQGKEARRDPSEAELFKNNQDDNEEYAGVDTLVRETIQNSIDAASIQAGNIVRVRISLHSKVEMPSTLRLVEYFERLEAPLKTKDVAYNRQGSPDLNCGFLVCEDFGTRGLEGNPNLTSDPTDRNKREDFYWFWRNIGRSGKTGDDLGRWGLGKTVYRAASRIGCMLGLTVRESDRRKIVMGQAVLKIHKFDGKEWKSDGFWCQKQGSDDTPIPIESPNDVEQFHADWKLSRTDEPGLSIVVPYVVKLTGESLFQAVAINFFDLILRRKLIVEINAPDIGSVKLTDQTIDTECSKIKWNGTKAQKRHAPPPIAFANACLTAKDKAVASKLWGTGNVDASLEFEPQDMETLQAEFKKGNLVAARIRIYLRKKNEQQSHEDSFFVFLQKDDRQKSPDSYYIREGMTITKINSSRARKNNTRGMVHVQKGLLASFLGDTEGPAHEDWLKSAERPDKIWGRGWKGRVDFVKGIVDKLYEIVSPRIEKADYDLLSEYFFSLDRKDIQDILPPHEQKASDNGHEEPQDADKEPSSFPPIDPHPQWFEIKPLSGGFRVSHSNLLSVPEDNDLEIQLAYDVSKGNPLQKWSPFDFDLKKDLQNGGRLKYKGLKLKAKALDGQTIFLHSISEGFLFEATGFDIHRDLFVKITEKSNENKEPEQ